ncbi:serine/threonine-protein kinase [Micromonospora sp. WMMD956]|uniref:serine/threonine-protein kinase n=2 Tax=unclassified Micromonospora TaxID=2617518 RepID=UPI0024181045|nr:serine/threonine-protein kinase [Micromonospora sp. WMMD956]MDG4820205.1 serine/threonine-protein kinase [Micromonospora sp. WMMD956]
MVKLVPRDPGADRELLLATDLDGVPNVVPVIESGETVDDLVLVMPRAEKSLLAHLEDHDGGLPAHEAVSVLTDIASALAKLDGRVVHRDLKPANVLLLDGRWCIADFGISRYADATTAPDTRKFAKTPLYAAPEQWRGERATSATDVYALGVLAFELLTGQVPFGGRYEHELREQHLHAVPPQLSGHAVPLASLVEECLFKPQGARPTPANVLARLQKVSANVKGSGLAALHEANRHEVARQGASHSAASAARSAAEERAALAEVAIRLVTRIGASLREAVMEAAPSARLKESHDGRWTLVLNNAELKFAPPAQTSIDPWGGWQPPAFDVIAHGALGVTIPTNSRGYGGRGHALWYCDAQERGRFGWYETAFMISPMTPKSTSLVPFAEFPGEAAAKAVWNGMAEYQVAWPFTAITVDDLHEFIDRWAGWFAAAAQGQLDHPTIVPERSPQGSWRQH